MCEAKVSKGATFTAVSGEPLSACEGVHGFPICDEFYCHKCSCFYCRTGSSDPGCMRGAVHSASKNGRDPRAVIRLGTATQHGLHHLLTFFVQSRHGSNCGKTRCPRSSSTCSLTSLVLTPVEYGLTTAPIAVAASAILGNLGTNLTSVFGKTANKSLATGGSPSRRAAGESVHGAARCSYPAGFQVTTVRKVSPNLGCG